MLCFRRGDCRADAVAHLFCETGYLARSTKQMVSVLLQAASDEAAPTGPGCPSRLVSGCERPACITLQSGEQKPPQPPLPEHDTDALTGTLEEELKPPPLYRVILLNDDYTPMEFVVHVLESFFHLNREQATQIMLTVHTTGRGVCGMYPRDMAETKAARVNAYAKQLKHPLRCEVEETD